MSFSHQVREWHPTAEALLADDGLMGSLKLWGAEARVENIRSERMLASLRKAVAGQKCRTAERVLSSGFLSQHLAAHRAAGGEEPTVTSRRQLLRMGVPTRASRSKRSSPTCPAHLLYINEKLPEGMSFEEMLAEKKKVGS